MIFIGQERIKRELQAILKDVIDLNANLNILFRAPSGCGKTTLGLLILWNLGIENCVYYVPDNDGLIYFNKDKRFHFIDEIHTLKNPETLYQLMDSGEYCFFLASNESGILKEPLRNRCINFIFDAYTKEEMSQIVTSNLKNWGLSDNMIEVICECSRNTPRVAKVLCQRLDHVFRNIFYPKTTDELRKLLNEIIDIKSDGTTRQDLIYLQFLENAGGRASLDAISYGTGIDKATILSEIEPFLLYKRKIRITSRGRTLC